VHALGWFAEPTQKEGIPSFEVGAAIDELVTRENEALF
jgi:hypothetical protein